MAAVAVDRGGGEELGFEWERAMSEKGGFVLPDLGGSSQQRTRGLARLNGLLRLERKQDVGRKKPQKAKELNNGTWSFAGKV